ncbi:12117_t:CDS:2 [Funneliformis mosseae]|uniref:12117_t:CDS:1 n=1 Tax=Funneliformis mosseae TaxID=27381 RepID=A0A9N9AIA0_FUNMO|nr:12117_t:CDS:2 [Funneliformis mosseae]
MTKFLKEKKEEIHWDKLPSDERLGTPISGAQKMKSQSLNFHSNPRCDGALMGITQCG